MERKPNGAAWADNFRRMLSPGTYIKCSQVRYFSREIKRGGRTIWTPPKGPEVKLCKYIEVFKNYSKGRRDAYTCVYIPCSQATEGNNDYCSTFHSRANLSNKDLDINEINEMERQRRCQQKYNESPEAGREPVVVPEIVEITKESDQIAAADRTKAAMALQGVLQTLEAKYSEAVRANEENLSAQSALAAINKNLVEELEGIRKDLGARVQEVENLSARLQQTSRENQNQIQDKTKLLKQLEENYQSQLAESNDLKSQNLELSRQITSLEVELESLNGQLEAKAKTYNAVLVQLENSKGEVAISQQEAAQKQSQIEELDQELEALKKDFSLREKELIQCNAVLSEMTQKLSSRGPGLSRGAPRLRDGAPGRFIQRYIDKYGTSKPWVSDALKKWELQTNKEKMRQQLTGDDSSQSFYGNKLALIHDVRMGKTLLGLTLLADSPFVDGDKAIYVFSINGTKEYEEAIIKQWRDLHGDDELEDVQVIFYNPNIRGNEIFERKLMQQGRRRLRVYIDDFHNFYANENSEKEFQRKLFKHLLSKDHVIVATAFPFVRKGIYNSWLEYLQGSVFHLGAESNWKNPDMFFKDMVSLYASFESRARREEINSYFQGFKVERVESSKLLLDTRNSSKQARDKMIVENTRRRRRRLSQKQRQMLFVIPMALKSRYGLVGNSLPVNTHYSNTSSILKAPFIDDGGLVVYLESKPKYHRFRQAVGRFLKFKQDDGQEEAERFAVYTNFDYDNESHLVEDYKTLATEYKKWSEKRLPGTFLKEKKIE